MENHKCYKKMDLKQIIKQNALIREYSHLSYIRKNDAIIIRVSIEGTKLNLLKKVKVAKTIAENKIIVKLGWKPLYLRILTNSFEQKVIIISKRRNKGREPKAIAQREITDITTPVTTLSNLFFFTTASSALTSFKIISP